MSKNDGWVPPLQELGGFIRIQRQMADLSLRQLSELTNVSNAYLSQIERGLHQPSLRVLRSIAAALNVSAETLLAQAGLADRDWPTRVSSADPKGGSAGDSAGQGTTEDVIANDSALTAEEREMLLSLYRTFRDRHSSA
jgi:transcriptional regulator with XRE-family HTH domain